MQNSEDELPETCKTNEDESAERSLEEADNDSEAKEESTPKRRVSKIKTPPPSPLTLKWSWFRSRENKKLYLENFEYRAIVPCNTFSPELIPVLPALQAICTSGGKPLLSLPTVYYSRLVRLFYANLTIADDKRNPTLKTKIMNTDITLTVKVACEISGLSVDYDQKIVPSGKSIRVGADELY